MDSSHFAHVAEVLPHNGDPVVVILGSFQVMITITEDNIRLVAHNIHLLAMAIILHSKHQEVDLVRVGSKGLQPLCRALHHRQTTTMGSHMVQIMASHTLIRHSMDKAMGMDTLMLNMTTRWHHKISMEDMDLLSQHLTLKVVHIPAMEPTSSMVNLLHMVCIHRLRIRSRIAIPGLINLEKSHIRVQFHQLKGMVLVCRTSSNTPMHPVGKCNKLTLHMDLPLLLMVDIIIHRVLQLLVLGILSKVPSLFLDTVSLCHNNLLLML